MIRIPMLSLDPGSLSGRRILLGVTGSIAAYKAPLLVRTLKKGGADVRVILTESARHFIGIPVFQGLGATVMTDMWAGPGEPHVELGKWAELTCVVPATADCLARMVQGRADDLLSATLLCTQAPVLVAPAMHPSMWSHPATVSNVSLLRERGVTFLGPDHGEVASGDVGLGRMLDPEDICQGIYRVLSAARTLLTGKHLLITAGPTREKLDPVRALTNLSSGKMGYAIAALAVAQGAQVTLISGPLSRPVPAGARLISVESALEMQAAMDDILGEDLTGVDALIMTAAVADYRAKTKSPEKLKRGDGDHTLELVPNPDLLASLGSRRASRRPVLVGFALESVTGDALIQLGRRKLVQKQVDMIVANAVDESLGLDDAVVQLVTALDCIPLGKMPKAEIAHHILKWVATRLHEPVTSDTTA